MTTPIQQYIGDTWVFLVQLVAGGQPVNLAGYTVGAELFLAYQATPIDLVLGSGVDLIDQSQGAYQVTVQPAQQVSVSPIAQPVTAKTFPTRLALWWIDTLSRRRTLALVMILPLDPRVSEADPSLPLGTHTVTVDLTVPGVAVVSVGTEMQGPPGPSSTPRTYPVAIATAGQTLIPLPVPPTVPSSVRLIVNGETFVSPMILVSDVACTWANPDFALEPSDAVTLSYV